MKDRLKLVCLSFDWRNLAKTNVGEMRAKFERDGIRLDECNLFLVSFGPENYYRKVDDHFETVHLRARFRHLRPLYALLLFLRLPALLTARGFSPDAILTYDMSLIFAAARACRRLGGITALFIANLPHSLLRTRPLSKLKLAVQHIIDRLGAPLVDACFVNSDATASYASAMGIRKEQQHRFFPDTISHDREVVERAHESKGAVRALLNIPHDALLLLSVGRLEPEKGFDRVLEAVATLAIAELVLVIAGSGKLEKDLKRKAHELGVAQQVRFVGSIPHEHLWQYYIDADAFILLSRSESLGMVALEAMYAGTPCIVSRAEGLLESAGEGNERAFVWGEEDGIEPLQEELRHIRTAHPSIAERSVRAKRYVQSRLREHESVLGVVCSV